MATQLRKKELKLIAYFLGLTSEDILTFKLVCKSWHSYLTPIISITDDEKEEEKSYIPSNTHLIQIQRSQPVLVSRTRNKPNNMIMSTSPLDFEDQKPQVSSTHTSPTLNPKKRHKSRRINPSDFLKHSLDRAFWRLDQTTLDKMIASGNSPHLKNLKITSINDELLTEKEKKYIEKERKHKHRHYHHSHSNRRLNQGIAHKSSTHAYTYASSPIRQHKISDYIPSGNNQLLHTPNTTESEYKHSVSETNTLTPILGPTSLKSETKSPLQHRKNDTFMSGSLKEENELKLDEQKYNINEVKNILADSSQWKPQYPLHLLQNDKSYQRHDAHERHKKRKRGEISEYRHHRQTDTLSTFDSEESLPKHRPHLKAHNTHSIQTNKLRKIPMPFSRSHTLNKQILDHSKSRSRNTRDNPQLLSTMFDPETFESGILSPKQSIPKRISDKKKKSKNPISRLLQSQPISQSMTKKYANNYNAPFLSPASSLYSETEEFNEHDFDDHFEDDYEAANNAKLREIINEGPVKDISFLPPSMPKKIYGLNELDSKHMWGSDASMGTTTDDDMDEISNGDIVMSIECKEREMQELADEDDAIKNLGDAGSSVVGSNLSKSLLLNPNHKRTRLNTDETLYFNGNNTEQRKRTRSRGWTTESAEMMPGFPRKVITPYELRKQHSLLRIIAGSNAKKKPLPSSLIGGDSNKVNKGGMLALEPILSQNARLRGVSTTSNVMSKLTGPLYSEEEKSNWNDMKKVDSKYQNILKKRRRKIVTKGGISPRIGHTPHSRFSNGGISETMTSTTVSPTVNRGNKSFWTNLYDWVIGGKGGIDSGDSAMDAGTDEVLQSAVTNSSTRTTTTTTTTSEDLERGVRRNENLLSSPLLVDVGDGLRIKQNLEDIEKRRETETTQISFWRDIVVPNWDLLHKTSVVKLFWEREGIPKSCRGQVWHYAIGNKLNIPSHSFDTVYRVSKAQICEYIAFVKEKERSLTENTMIKSILGGNTISTRSILSVTPKKERKLVNEAGKTVHFCEGIKRKNSIERDISRLFGSESFADLMLNSIDKKHEDIACVLMAYCNCRKSIGYIQFMTHLVQILLNYQSPKIAFISLCNMLSSEIFEIYIHCNVAEIRQRIEIFTKMLVYNSSEIARHLQKLSILADTYVMDWCNGLFSSQLPLNIVSRIWDLYFLNGEIIIWKCAVALLILLNENLDICHKSHHKIVKILQSIKKSLQSHNIALNEEEFVKKIYAIKLPRDVRKWFKRKEHSRKKRVRKRRRKRRRKQRKHRHQNRQKQQKHQTVTTNRSYNKNGELQPVNNR